MWFTYSSFTNYTPRYVVHIPLALQTMLPDMCGSHPLALQTMLPDMCGSHPLALQTMLPDMWFTSL